MLSKSLQLELHEYLEFSSSRVWEILSDTDHLNRFLRLPKVRYEAPVQNQSSLFRVAIATVFGFIRVRWIEYPFEWDRNRGYSVVRDYLGGPIRRIRLAVDTRTRGSGTEVVVRCEVDLKWAFLNPFVRLAMRSSLKKILAYARKSVQLRVQDESSRIAAPLPIENVRNSGGIRALIDRTGVNFADRFGAELRWLDRLSTLLCEGSDRQVLNLRPFELARDWNVPRLQVLEFFLHATERGAFELDWQLQCPNCQVSKAQTRSLKDIANAFHCDMCGIDIETDLADSVELRFRIHPRLRSAVEETYCLMGPYQSRHILSQYNLRSGESRALPPQAFENRRCRVLGDQKQNKSMSIAPTDGATLVWKGGWTADVASGTSRPTTIKNESATTVTVVLENVEKDPFMVSAAYVTSLQTFRNLFSAEVLAVGTTVAVRHLTFLFSDLKDSTALYKSVGDAAAFGRVQKHFVYLQGLLSRHEGALVKTMGDAIMAVFSDPANAFACALAMQEELAAFNVTHAMVPPVVLKLGLHCGPSIAIENEGRLDYFGTTVNYAARIQGQSEGGDIVLSDDFLNSFPIPASIEQTWSSEKFIATLKGIGAAERCLRLKNSQLSVANLRRAS